MRLISMLLLLLIACTPAPTPEAGIVYRSTTGGPALSTTLQIWNPTRSALLNTITSAVAGGIDGGYKWQLAPNGNTLQMEFAGRNDRVGIPPRGVVQLLVDGQEAFYGVMPDPAAANSQDAQTMQVLGGQEALRVALMDGTVYRDQGVFGIVRDLLSRLCPPALTFEPALIGNGSGVDAGPTLSLFYSPTSDLVTVLDGLAKSAATSWGVDSGGRVFFGRPAPAALNVAYAGQPWKSLPMQGREAVTRAVLRIVSAPSLPDGGTATWTDGVPQTVTTVATAVAHGLYHAEQSFAAPGGVGLLVPSVPAGTSPSSDYSGTAVMDSDPSTGVDINLTTTQRNLLVDSVLGRVVGVEFDYTLPATDDMPANGYQWALLGLGGPTDSGADAVGNLPASNDLRTLRVILPPTASVSASWGFTFLIGATLAVTPTPTCLLTVTRVRFLVVDEDAAQRVAQSYLQAPFAAPAEISLRGLLPPTPDITVTDSPDGTVSGPTSLWEYQHDDQDVYATRIRIGATGADPTVRALKWAVRGR